MQISENDKIWHLLKEAIHQKKVVPIIGDEFFFVENDGERMLYSQFLLEELCRRFPVPANFPTEYTNEDMPIDFNMIADIIRINNFINSQMYGMVGMSTNIYYEIDKIVKEYPVKCDDRLIDFLSKHHFPIILTTSFLPGIENALREVNDAFNTKAYDKSPRQDVKDDECDMLYYLFGRVNKLNKSFMVTENDLLDYMHFWHTIENRPTELCKILSSKFLLVLGCDYPNWLFRFFWHSIKNFNIIEGSEDVKGIVAANILDSDCELTRFLSRIQTHAYGNSNEVLDILLKLQPMKEHEDSITMSNEASEDDKPDVFISYSHEDAEKARDIAHTFEACGAKVWFDSSSLVGSDLYDDIIRRKIEKCERFVPVLSSYTENAKRGYFRKEWALSIDENRFRLGSPYISPIVIDNVDIYSSRIPKEFREAHILNYDSPDFKKSVKKLIRSFR